MTESGRAAVAISTILRHRFFKKLDTKLKSSAKDAKYITSPSAKFYDDNYRVGRATVLKSLTVY